MERQNWFKERGDETLALNWPLDEESYVWEIGGFKGRWVNQIVNKFNCFVTVFEPQLWAAKIMMERFKGDAKVDIRPYGLWLEDDILPIGDFGTDGASVIKLGVNATLGYFRNYYKEIYEFNVIDVGLMNIEGSEYTLLPALIESNLISRFEHFWCQFHPGLTNDSGERFNDICDGMDKTHEMLWDCYPTAVAWKRR